MGTICELGDRMLEIIQSEQQRKKTEKEKKTQGKWNCSKRSNNWVTGVPEVKENKGIELKECLKK